MKKVEAEYKKEYGHIPRRDDEIFRDLLNNTNLNKKSRSILFDRINHNLNLEWETLDFIIYLLPKATPRPRHNIARNIFYVSGAKDNRHLFEKFMIKQDLPLITTPCKFRCISYFPIPKSMNSLEKILSEMGLIRPISKPDWDNLGKTYSDMIQDSLLYDDSLIVEGVSKKFYSSKPRIEIHMEYMKEYDSEFNEKKIRKKVK